MPFIEFKAKDDSDKLLIINTDSIVQIVTGNGSYGPFLKVTMNNGTDIYQSYESVQEAHNTFVAISNALPGDIPGVTL